MDGSNWPPRRDEWRADPPRFNESSITGMLVAFALSAILLGAISALIALFAVFGIHGTVIIGCETEGIGICGSS
jgi:hypothetical protein